VRPFPLFEDVAPGLLVRGEPKAIIVAGQGSDQDVIAGVAHEPVGPFTADQNVGAAAAAEVIVTRPAEGNTATIAEVQLIISIVSIQPDFIRHLPGDLDVVVAVIAEDNNPAGRTVGAP